MEELRTHWRRGEKAELARRVGVREPYLHDLLAGRRNPSPTAALNIEEQALEMGLNLRRLDLLYPEHTSNPLMNVGASDK